MIGIEKKKVGLVLIDKSRANQLLSFFYQELSKHPVEVLVFCPPEVAEYIDGFAKENGITVEKIENLTSPGQFSWSRIIDDFRAYVLVDRNLTPGITWIVKAHKEGFGKGEGRYTKFVTTLADLLKILPGIKNKKFWNFLERATLKNKNISKVFKRHQFDWIIFPCFVLYHDELPIFWEAKRRGVKTASIDESFGAFVVKYYNYRDIDRIFVWNKITIEQALKYHQIDKEKMVISGPHRFDGYFRQDIFPSRQDFFGYYDLNSNKKLITLASSKFVKPSLVEFLARAVNNGRLKDCQLLYRPTSKDRLVERYKDFKKYKNVFIDERSDYEKLMSLTGVKDKFSLSTIQLGSLLKHSDVVICVGSTLAIEAGLFGTPTIYLGYGPDISETLEFGQVKEVIETGAVGVAKSPGQLISLINDFINNRDLLSQERKKLVKKICTFVDGKSSKRIVEGLDLT